MTLPTLLFVGPFKSGTTWVSDYFADRGDICLPAGVKETFFFDRHMDKGLGWYEAHFDHFDATKHVATCEVAPSYLHGDDLPATTHKTLGAVPTVIIHRDPVARSWSHFLHMRRKGYTRGDIYAAVAEFPSIVDASRTSKHATRWASAMGSDNVHVIDFDALEADPNVFATQICNILNLPLILPEAQRMAASNVSGVSRSYFVSQVSRKISEVLRRNRLHGLVNFAKSLGLHKVAYSGGSKAADPTLTMDDAARNWLRSQLDDEYAAMDAASK